MGLPNIVFVFADQLRYDALGCNGNQIVRTPNIDSLARDGVCLDQAYSATPICSPYRAQLLTGNYAHTNGVICNEYRLFDDQKTLPQVLKENGYRTAFVGKWHLGYGPYPEHKRYGFDDLYAYNCIHNYYDVQYWHNEDAPRKIEGFAPEGETDLAIEYLRQHASGQSRSKQRPGSSDDDTPVCLMMSWGPPHWNDLGKTRRYGDYPEEFNRYRPEDLEISDNVPAPLVDYTRNQLADYYGMVSAIDASMGRLLSAIDDMGLGENTIVCFSSDHGDFIGSHGRLTPADWWLPQEGRLSKASPHTEACKIPFIIRYPGQAPLARRSDCLFNSVDVMPTLLSLCGIDCPDVQGSDLSHAVLGTAGNDPDSVYFQIMGPGWPNRTGDETLWRGVRTHDYIYARWKFPLGRRLLIDLNNDPDEVTNLADSADHSRTVVEMERLLSSWIERTGDPFDTGERLPDTGMLDVGQGFITRRWQDQSPQGYATGIAGNMARFKTGEQPGDRTPLQM